ncbi:MAG: hypothetical protein QW158_07475, partial [Nitrososphaerales archaeon]
MKIVIDREVSDKFPELDVLVRCVRGVVVKPFDEELEKFKSEVCSEVRGKYTLESVKNVAIFRAYRDFFW